MKKEKHLEIGDLDIIDKQVTLFETDKEHTLLEQEFIRNNYRKIIANNNKCVNLLEEILDRDSTVKEMLELVNSGKDIKLLESYLTDLSDIFKKIRSSHLTQWEYERLFTKEKLGIIIKSQTTYQMNDITELLRVNDINQFDLVRHIINNKLNKFSGQFEKELLGVTQLNATEKLLVETKKNLEMNVGEMLFTSKDKDQCVEKGYLLKDQLEKMMEMTDYDKQFKGFEDRIELMGEMPSLDNKGGATNRIEVLEDLLKEKSGIIDQNMINFEDFQKKKDVEIQKLNTENCKLKCHQQEIELLSSCNRNQTSSQDQSRQDIEDYGNQQLSKDFNQPHYPPKQTSDINTQSITDRQETSKNTKEIDPEIQSQMNSIRREKEIVEENLQKLIEEKAEVDNELKNLYNAKCSTSRVHDDQMSKASDEIQKLENLKHTYDKDKDKLRIKLQETEMDKVIQIERLTNECNKFIIEINTLKENLDFEKNDKLESNQERDRLNQAKNQLKDELEDLKNLQNYKTQDNKKYRDENDELKKSRDVLIDEANRSRKEKNDIQNEIVRINPKDLEKLGFDLIQGQDYISSEFCEKPGCKLNQNLTADKIRFGEESKITQDDPRLFRDQSRKSSVSGKSGSNRRQKGTDGHAFMPLSKKGKHCDETGGVVPSFGNTLTKDRRPSLSNNKKGALPSNSNTGKRNSLPVHTTDKEYILTGNTNESGDYSGEGHGLQPHSLNLKNYKRQAETPGTDRLLKNQPSSNDNTQEYSFEDLSKTGTKFSTNFDYLKQNLKKV